MKIWESPDKEKNRYRGGAAWKAAGIAVVMMALTVITVALSFFLSASLGISREQILMTGCILTVLFGVWLSAWLGNRVLRDAQIFFADDDGRLYVLDARLFIQYRKGFPGFVQMDRDMRKQKEAVLQQMRKDHMSAYILISLLLFAVCTGLCILSHPSVAYLPQTIYFPCLGLDFAFVWVLTYLIVKRRRGE